jgi:hypothetical protein
MPRPAKALQTHALALKNSADTCRWFERFAGPCKYKVAETCESLRKFADTHAVIILRTHVKALKVCRHTCTYFTWKEYTVPKHAISCLKVGKSADT